MIKGQIEGLRNEIVKFQSLETIVKEKENSLNSENERIAQTQAQLEQEIAQLQE